MKRLVALLLVGVLLVLPLASADDSGQASSPEHSQLRFTSFPQVYVNVSNNASFNVSYIGLILISSSGAFYSYFPAQNWVVKRDSNISVSYRSSIIFQHLDLEHITLLANRFNVTNLKSIAEDHADGPELEYVHANATVTMKKVHVSSPVINNSTISNLTGFKISFSLTSSQIIGPGDLFLIQSLGARIHNGYQAYHALTSISHGLKQVNGSAIGVNSTGYNAYYWWEPTYTVNGHTHNLSASSSRIGNTDILVYKFQFQNGITSLSQDPYFSIPQINLFSNPILQKDIQNAAHFLVLHIEFLSAGLITGSILVGISYASYRRKRF